MNDIEAFNDDAIDKGLIEELIEIIKDDVDIVAIEDEEIPKKIKKDTRNYYFTQETQESIFKFLNDEMSVDDKNTLYAEKIRPAFNKLVENLIFIYGINNTEHDYITLKHDCVVFLYENLHKFDFDKGSKAFSYFNIVAKNWLILQAKQTSRRAKHHILYNDRNSTDELSKYNLMQDTVEPVEEEVVRNEFFMVLVEEITDWKDKTKNVKEQSVLSAIHQLFTNIDSINIYDKKAVFLYLKEITGMSTKQLCVNVNKIRTRYDRFKKKYHKDS